MGYGPIERKPGIGRIAGHSVDIIGDQGEVSQDTGDRGGLRSSKLAMDPGEQKDERCKLAAFEKASCHRQVQWTKDLGKLIRLLGEATVGGIMALGPRCTPGRKPIQFFQISPSPSRLVPNLASSAVPRFQPLQAVATCSPHLVRSPAPPLVQDQRAVFLCIGQCYTVLVNVVTESLVFPQWFLATMPTIKCLHIPKLHLPSCYNQVRS